MWEGELSYTRKSFGHQHIVNEAGQFDSDTRNDNLWVMDLGLKYPRMLRNSDKVIPGIEFTYIDNISNQNDYDATNAHFTPDYYAYRKYQAGINLDYQRQIKPKQNMDLSFTAWYARTNYPSRYVQDSSGSYGSDKIYLNEYVFRAALSYPIAPKFKWFATIQYGKQSSNMSYEKLYKYNFDIFVYLLGVNYEYD